jgi:polyphosphate kinase 2 (PPK2 family)
MASRTYADEKDGRRSALDKKGNPQDETTRTRASSEVAVEDAPGRDYPRYSVEPGERVSLAAIDPEETEHYRRKKEVAKALEKQRRRIQGLQARLYAENERGLLIVLQAMDTGGKDGTIKHVFSGVNPQGCRVSSFKTPSAEEANHDFL